MTLIIIILKMLFLNLSISNVQARTNSNVHSIKDNVLIIIVDDLRHLTDKSVILPNIQRIAANGVNFENAFAQQALCAPSRNSMLTGRRPDSLRLYDFYSYWRDSVGNFTTLPQLFKENGYDTYSVGKVFHPGVSSNFTDDFPYSWTELPYHPTTEKYKDSAVCKDKITRKLQKNLICPVDVKEQPGDTLPDLQSLEYALNILRERNNRSRPFFLAVGFHKPHIPLKFPQKYLDRVPLNKTRPPKHPNIPTHMPTVAWHPWSDVRSRDDIARLNISFPFGIMPRPWTLKIRQGYYAAATYVDDLVGSLMQHVDVRNTVVVLTSDHGWSLGENGLWAKYSNFDDALKVPLIFQIPGAKPNTVKAPVELIDIFPTLAEVTGLSGDIPKCTNGHETLCFEGKSLVNFMTKALPRKSNVARIYPSLSLEYYKSDRDGDIRTSIFDLHYSTENNVEEYFAISQYPRPSVYPIKTSDKPRLKNIKIMGYSIRTNKYRYTEWVSFNSTGFIKDWNKIYGMELYDHITDPCEAHNVVSKRKYRLIRKYLSKLLRKSVDKKYLHKRGLHQLTITDRSTLNMALAANIP